MRRRSAAIRKRAAPGCDVIALFVGIDGGQSSTVATLGDETRILSRGSGPPADLVGEARDSGRQRAALAEAVASALDAAGLSRGTRMRALVAGISGFDAGYAEPPALDDIAERSSIVHDAAIAHAGALDGAPGIVVIAGTGSVALGNTVSGGPFERCGGWGYFFGDDGGAVWIAREALRIAMSSEDRKIPSPLAERACAFYGTHSLRAIQHAFAHGEIGRPALAAFATDVLAFAREGDVAAAGVRTAAADALALLVNTVKERLGAAENIAVSTSGGLFRDPGLMLSFVVAMRSVLPEARVARPVHDAAGGALVLARRLGTP